MQKLQANLCFIYANKYLNQLFRWRSSPQKGDNSNPFPCGCFCQRLFKIRVKGAFQNATSAVFLYFAQFSLLTPPAIYSNPK